MSAAASSATSVASGIDGAQGECRLAGAAAQVEDARARRQLQAARADPQVAAVAGIERHQQVVGVRHPVEARGERVWPFRFTPVPGRRTRTPVRGRRGTAAPPARSRAGSSAAAAPAAPHTAASLPASGTTARPAVTSQPGARDAVADCRVDGARGADRQCRAPRQGNEALLGAGIVARGKCEHLGHHGTQPVTRGARQRFAGPRAQVAEPGTREPGDRQVDPAEVPVFQHVAADVGELHGHAQLRRRLQCGIVAQREDVRHHQADRAGDAVAVAQQLGQVLVRGLLQVHAHAGEHLARVVPRHAGGGHHRAERVDDRVAGGGAAGDPLQLVVQRGQRRRPLRGRRAVDGVVRPAAPGVHHQRRAPAVARQQVGGEREALGAGGDAAPAFGRHLRGHRVAATRRLTERHPPAPVSRWRAPN